jgi:hypothetical protein
VIARGATVPGLATLKAWISLESLE